LKTMEGKTASEKVEAYGSPRGKTRKKWIVKGGKAVPKPERMTFRRGERKKRGGEREKHFMNPSSKKAGERSAEK